MSDFIPESEILRIFLFLLSQMGWWRLIGYKQQIHPCFLPIVTACSQMILLIFGGMIGQLFGTITLLWWMGLAYFLLSMLRPKGLQAYLSPGFLFLFGMFCLIWMATRGKIVVEHDNFSHWGTLIRWILETGKFLDSGSAITEHFTYPMGSTVWILFFAKLTNPNNEAMWMCGQGLFLIYCIVPMFSLFPEKRRIGESLLGTAFIFFAANAFLYYNTRIYSLMVDTQLPLLGGAAALLAFQEGQKKWSLIYLIPLLASLVQIKFSGIFFFLVCIPILLWNRHDEWKNKGFWVASGAVFALPFLPQIFWSRYCATHFMGLTAKHAGTLSSFLGQFRIKSAADISTILFQTVRYTIRSEYFICFVIFAAAVLGVSALLMEDDDFGNLALISGAIILAYLLYMASTAGMYIFSMPREDALRLATIDRYQKSFLLYGYMLTCCQLLYAAFHSVRRIPIRFISGDQYQKSVTLVCILLLMSGGWYIMNRNHFRTIFDSYGGTYLKPRIQLEEALTKAGTPAHAECVILRKSNALDYRSLLVFELGTPRNLVRNIAISNSEQLVEIQTAYQAGAWIFIEDTKNPAIQQWMEEMHGEARIVVIPQ